ncbi:MAG: nucleotidyltransferase domain-containing protein [Candidatus Woesearchaeota archaeon]
MLTPTQLKIFGTFGKDTFKEYSFKELKRAAHATSNSLVQNATAAFIKEGLVTSRKVGTTRLYKLNHRNDKAYDYLRLHNHEKLPREAHDSISIIQEQVDKETTFYSLVVFGSYATGTQTEESDLDVAAIIPDEKTRKNVEVALNTASNRTPLKLDHHTITAEELKKMLFTDHENLGKEIARKNLPVHNPATFYRLLVRISSHGWNPLPGTG